MRRFVFFILFLLSVSIFFADTSGILSTAEIAQLVDMLDSAGLTSNSLKFEKDWDLSTKYKLNWQLNQLQNPWLALEDIQHIKDLCDSSESGELEQLLRELGGIAFNLNPYQFTTLYPSAKSVYNSQLKKEVQKPEDIFKWLDAHLKNFKKEFNQVTRDVNRNRLMEFQSYWLWQFIEAEDTLTYKSYFAQKNLPENKGKTEKQILDAYVEKNPDIKPLIDNFKANYANVPQTTGKGKNKTVSLVREVAILSDPRHLKEYVKWNLTPQQILAVDQQAFNDGFEEGQKPILYRILPLILVFGVVAAMIALVLSL